MIHVFFSYLDEDRYRIIVTAYFVAILFDRRVSSVVWSGFDTDLSTKILKVNFSLYSANLCSFTNIFNFIPRV